MNRIACTVVLFAILYVNGVSGGAVTVVSGNCVIGGDCTIRATAATTIANTKKLLIAISEVQSDTGDPFLINIAAADTIKTWTGGGNDKKHADDTLEVKASGQVVEVQKKNTGKDVTGATVGVVTFLLASIVATTPPGLTGFKVSITGTDDATPGVAWIPVFKAASAATINSIALGTSYIKAATPGELTFQFYPQTALTTTSTVTLTATDAVFTKSTAADVKYIKSVKKYTMLVAADLAEAGTVTGATDATGKILTIAWKSAVSVTDMNLMLEVILQTTTGNTLLAKNPANPGLVGYTMKTDTDTVVSSYVNVPIFNAAATSLFVKATRATSYVKSIAGGALTMYMVPSQAIAAGSTVTFKTDVATFTARRATAAASAQGVGADATAATSDTKTLVFTTANSGLLSKRINYYQITDQLPNNGANTGAVKFTVDSNTGDNVETAAATGYSIFNHADTALFSSASRATSLVSGAAGGNLVLTFVPQTTIVGNNAAKTVTFTASSAIFEAGAPTVACTSKLGAEPAWPVTCTAAVADTAAGKKTLTVTATVAGENFVAQAACTVTVSTKLAKNGAAGAITFDLATAHETTATGAQTGYTITAAAASGSAAASAAATTSTKASTVVTQVLTFATLKAAEYIGDTKKTAECSYVQCIDTTWCIAASKKTTYKAGVSITSSAARRSAKVTFVTTVETSVATKASLQTKVASGVTTAKFKTQLEAVTTATGYTVATFGAATVATASFKAKGAASSASIVVPSIVVTIFGALSHFM